jgi:hypothetical protein
MGARPLDFGVKVRTRADGHDADVARRVDRVLEIEGCGPVLHGDEPCTDGGGLVVGDRGVRAGEEEPKLGRSADGLVDGAFIADIDLDLMRGDGL